MLTLGPGAFQQCDLDESGTLTVLDAFKVARGAVGFTIDIVCPGSPIPVTCDPAGRAWTERVGGAAPPERYGGSMTFDSVRGECVLFSGGHWGGRLGDTWTWDGTSWTQHSPAVSPLARELAGFAFDEARGVAVLHGGKSGGHNVRFGRHVGVGRHELDPGLPGDQPRSRRARHGHDLRLRPAGHRPLRDSHGRRP